MNRKTSRLLTTVGLLGIIIVIAVITLVR